jgi:anti-sigma regulatory factor (Ser/Thr protein kinase)
VSPQRWRSWYPCAPASVGRVRNFVRAVCGVNEIGEDDTASLLLVADELATNCVLHGRSSFKVELWLGDGTMRVEVADHSTLPPLLSWADATSTARGGRGLQIVDRLSSDWGVDAVHGNGKVVWATLPRT